MPDPVNNETGNLGDGRSPSEQPTNSPSSGGTRQTTQYHQSGQPDGSRATAEGGMNSNATPLHTDGGNAQHTGSPAGVDVGGAEKPAIYASGMPIWTETLESVQATPEKIIQSLEERGYLMPMGGSESSPLPGAEQAQNPDAPQHSKVATGPSMEPGEGDKSFHWWFRPFGSRS